MMLGRGWLCAAGRHTGASAIRANTPTLACASLPACRGTHRAAHTHAKMAVDAAMRALRRSTKGEIALGVLAIGCVSVFGLLEPA